MIRNHGSTFLKASLKDKDAIKRSLSTNVEKKSSINLNTLGFAAKNLEEKISFELDSKAVSSICNPANLEIE